MNVSRVQTAFVSSCLAALAACVSLPVWDKPGSSPALADADFDECRRLVLDDTWRRDWERNWPPQFYDPDFMPPYYRSLQPFWFDFSASLERESAMIDFCMHSKGYRLRALPVASGHRRGSRAGGGHQVSLPH